MYFFGVPVAKGFKTLTDQNVPDLSPARKPLLHVIPRLYIVLSLIKGEKNPEKINKSIFTLLTVKSVFYLSTLEILLVVVWCSKTNINITWSTAI